MIAALIGITSGLLTIAAISLIKGMHKSIVYGLILTAIGFLYVGFTWMNLRAITINSVQAICFLFLAYYGVTKHVYFLIAGYFLHGCWDFLYSFFQLSDLIPPHYDLFCLSIDFTIGFYLLAMHSRSSLRVSKHVLK